MISRSWTLTWARVGDAAGAQGVRGDAVERLAAIAGLPGARLEDRPDALGQEALAAEGVAAGDAARHPALADAGGVEPTANRPHGTVRGERIGGDMDKAALPCGPKDRSPTRISTGSERRKAPAKPSRIGARSRSPCKSPPQMPASLMTSAMSSGAG